MPTRLEYPPISRLLQFCFVSKVRQNKFGEAKVFAQYAADGAEGVLGMNHPKTLLYEKLWQELQSTNLPSKT